ncbi:MAG: nucleoside transporter C-terminal domain-containing protein [Flavobacteriaceae bacterium]
MQKLFFLVIVFFFTQLITSQEIEKEWKLNSFENNGDITSYSDSTDVLSLEKGVFHYKIADKVAKGDYIHQNNILIFYYDEPKDTVVKHKITELTDSTFVFNSINSTFKVSSVKLTLAKIPEITIKPSEGFTLNSFLRGALGMFFLLIISYLLSVNRKAINWKTVGIGLSAQLLLAFGVLKVPFIQKAFEFVGGIFVLILDFTKAGSEFLLGGLMDVSSYGFIFLFQILPTIIFFSALTSLLFYLGVIQVIVKGMAWVLTKLMGISGAESLSVAGNIFLGQTEAPLMIKAYLEKMTRSEILLVMVGGMATVAGGVLAAYIGFLGGDDPALRLHFAKHLLAASVMAAPGAIVISKMLYPQQNQVNTDVKVSQDKIGSNILDAIANGTTEGLKLAANVGAMLLVFIAFIAMINYVLGDFIGHYTGLNDLIVEYTPYKKFSLETILGVIFAPLMWLIGVAKEDIMLMGQLLGIKLAASEFVGYVQLAELKNVASAAHLTYNKSVIMATYMLCGFANFASIGIQIGGIGSLAPGQRKTLSEFGLKAVIGGTLASLLSATIAGMIIG